MLMMIGFAGRSRISNGFAGRIPVHTPLGVIMETVLAQWWRRGLYLRSGLAEVCIMARVGRTCPGLAPGVEEPPVRMNSFLGALVFLQFIRKFP